MNALPSSTSCTVCGEYHHRLLQVVGDEVLCASCRDRHHVRGTCELCGVHGPIERHHVGGRAHPEMMTLCLTCHRLENTMRARQRDLWRTGSPGARTLQGQLNLAMLADMRLPPPPRVSDLSVVVLAGVIACYVAADPVVLLRLLAAIGLDAQEALTAELSLTTVDWSLLGLPEVQW